MKPFICSEVKVGAGIGVFVGLGVGDSVGAGEGVGLDEGWGVGDGVETIFSAKTCGFPEERRARYEKGIPVKSTPRKKDIKTLFIEDILLSCDF